MTLRLGHVCLGTPRLAAMSAFYREHFGCRVVHEFVNDEGFRYGVFLAVGEDTFLELFHEEEASPDEVPGERNAGRFRHFAFEVDDIEGWAARFRALGQDVTVARGRTDGALGCWIVDPDGNRVELHEYDGESVQARARAEHRRARALLGGA